jgi:hypothetical protein
MASLKDTSLNLKDWEYLSTIVSEKNVSIAAGENVEFRIQAAKSATVQVKGIIIRADNQRLVINSDYTNVGKWSSFKVTANGDKLPDTYYTLKTTGTDDTSDTSIKGNGSDAIYYTITYSASWTVATDWWSPISGSVQVQKGSIPTWTKFKKGTSEKSCTTWSPATFSAATENKTYECTALEA